MIHKPVSRVKLICSARILSSLLRITHEILLQYRKFYDGEQQLYKSQYIIYKETYSSAESCLGIEFHLRAEAPRRVALCYTSHLYTFVLGKETFQLRVSMYAHTCAHRRTSSNSRVQLRGNEERWWEREIEAGAPRPSCTYAQACVYGGAAGDLVYKLGLSSGALTSIGLNWEKLNWALSRSFFPPIYTSTSLCVCPYVYTIYASTASSRVFVESDDDSGRESFAGAQLIGRPSRRRRR